MKIIIRAHTNHKGSLETCTVVGETPAYFKDLLPGAVEAAKGQYIVEGLAKIFSDTIAASVIVKHVTIDFED